MSRVSVKLGALFAAGAACVMLAAGPASAGAPSTPDLTGLWTNAGAPALGGTTQANAVAPPPIRPEAQAKVDNYRKLVTPTGETPGQYCLGTGMPGSMLGSGGYPMMIMQRPEQIVVIYEAHTELRQFFFGARNAAQEDRVPGRNGYSSARWEGDTLVVETDNLVEQVDLQRFPHSANAKIVERYTLEGKDEQGRRILKAVMTMTDPDFYTGPVVAEKRWAEVPNGRLLPYECAEENWNIRLQALAKQAGVPVPNQ